MNLIGVRLMLWVGPDPVAVPPPPQVLEALTDVEVTHSDKGPSGFRLTFTVGRSSPLDFLDYSLVGATSPLQKNARVVLTVIFDITPVVIMDGIVTQRDVMIGDGPGQGRLVLTGHDLSIVMDRESVRTEHPAQDETIITYKIAASYAMYGMIPMALPPVFLDPPIPMDRTPTQNCSDWAYLNRMAERHGYVCYIDAGPAPLTNTLYWGPPVRPDIPQKALNVNQGHLTNTSSVSLSQDALAPTMVETTVQDRMTGQDIPVMTIMPTRPPLGLLPETLTSMGSTRKKFIATSGLNAMQAFARAQAELDLSSDDAVTVTGTLDSVRYNDVLKARAQVDMRGAGFSFDGTYRVRQVTHRISRGSYEQDFVISRGEMGAKLPVVRPC